MIASPAFALAGVATTAFLTSCSVGDHEKAADGRAPLRAGEDTRCDPTPGRRAAPRVGVTLGRGPAYPVLGFEQRPPKGVAQYEVVRGAANGRPNRLKVLWALGPTLRRPASVEGHRIEDGARVFFQPAERRRPAPKLTLRPPHGSWSYLPSTIFLGGPGCYRLRIRYASHTATVIFRATATEIGD